MSYFGKGLVTKRYFVQAVIWSPPTTMRGRLSRMKRYCSAFVTPLLVCMFLWPAGCATRMSTNIASPFSGERPAGPTANQHVAEVLAAISERNAKVENSPEWRNAAYDRFMIRNFSSLDEQDYGRYASYLDNGEVYIIVHPAYYTFFRDDSLFPDPPGSGSAENAMDRFLSEGSYSSRSRLIKAQEKQLRDFLEYMSTDHKLVILVLPHDYRDYPAYKFRKGKDEFMRFINEVTNESDSVLYLFSKRPNRGSLSEREKRKLLRFLYTIKAKEVLLGGGYVGRCLEDFYKDIEQYFKEDSICLVPEITAISPNDIGSGAASDMLNPDGTINVKTLSESIRKNIVGNQDVVPRIKNLSPPYAGQ